MPGFSDPKTATATATNAQERRTDVFIGSNRSRRAERFAAVGMLFFDGQLRRDKFAGGNRKTTDYTDSTDGQIRVISEQHERA